VLLDRLLGALEVDVAPFAICEIRRGWSVDVPPDGHVALHFVVAGEGRVSSPGGPAEAITPGTVVVVPSGRAHRIELPHDTTDVMDAAADCSVSEHGLRRMVAGDGDDDLGLLMVCGSMRATYAGAFGIFDGLEHPLVVDLHDDASIRVVFEQLLAEQAALAPGSAVMMRALMTQGLVALMRRLCDGNDCRLTWLGALGDPQLSRAIEAIVDAPDAPHTVESLARRAGMSRSSFAEHFTRAFGRPAIDMLREVRLRRAADLLRTTDLSVAAIAKRVGYASRSHLSKSFAAMFGADPSAYRVQSQSVR
jgi:AraC-like DNA-binding protein